MIEISKLVRRARVKIGKKDFSDGWSARISSDAKRYTVIQNVETTIRYDDDVPHSAAFVEAWKSGARPIVDSFMVTGWYRIGTEGALTVKATAWVVPKHVSFASMGLTKGKVGVDPWGAAYGAEGHLRVPSGVQVIERNVEIKWDNVQKKYLDEYDRGKDLKIKGRRKSYVLK